MSMKRRTLLKSLMSLPIVVGFSGFVQKKLRKTVVVSEAPMNLVGIDDELFPEAKIDLNTGKLYIEVEDKELQDTEFIARPRSKKGSYTEMGTLSVMQEDNTRIV